MKTLVHATRRFAAVLQPNYYVWPVNGQGLAPEIGPGYLRQAARLQSICKARPLLPDQRQQH